MDEVFTGQIMLFAGNFVPQGYVACDGSLLSTQDYPHLFSLIGTTYGGDGSATFGVPDLRNRVPLGAGSGPGLTARTLGETGGEAGVTLTVNQTPAHNHILLGTNANATDSVPGPTNMFGNGAVGQILPYNDTTRALGAIGSFSNMTITPAGGPGGPHENRMPSVGIQFVMATEGTYPSP